MNQNNFFIAHGGFWVVVVNCLVYVAAVIFMCNEYLKLHKNIFFENIFIEILTVNFVFTVVFYVTFNLFNIWVQNILHGHNEILKLLYQIY